MAIATKRKWFPRMGWRFALALAWVVYLAVIGPWLISADSTIAVLVGLAGALILVLVTYQRAVTAAAINRKEENA